MATSASYYDGRAAASGYVRVGHNSTTTNPDAVWKIKPTKSYYTINAIKVYFSWNNDAAGTGWQSKYTYKCALYNSGNTVALKTVTFSAEGRSGTGNITISGLTLSSGSTYYLHFNCNSNQLSTMKAFSETGVSYDIAGSTPLSYTLTVKNGSTSAISSVSGGGTKSYGANVTVGATLSSTKGYTTTFTRWTSSNTSLVANSSSKSYTFSMPAGNVTLTATGSKTANTYKNTFDKRGGIGGTNEATVTYGQIPATITPPTKSGYTFNGYFSTLTGIDSPDVSDDYRLYKANGAGNRAYTWDYSFSPHAGWIANNYTITFDASGGQVETKSKIVTFGQPLGELPIPIRPAYEFLGWFTISGVQVSEETIINVPENQTLYARWEIKGAVRIYTNGEYSLSMPYIWSGNKYSQCIPYVWMDGAWKIGG